METTLTAKTMTRAQTKAAIYAATKPFTSRFYSDTCWVGPCSVFEAMNRLGIDYTITSAKYDGGTPATSKTWKFEIRCLSPSGKEQTLYGYLTAAGAGSVADPMARYDLVLVIS